MKRVEEPFLIVVFGASGDLANRKLIPALYHLATEQLLPEGFTLLGFARTDYGDEDFRTLVLDGLREHMKDEHNGKNFDEAQGEAFVRHCFYQQGAYDSEESF